METHEKTQIIPAAVQVAVWCLKDAALCDGAHHKQWFVMAALRELLTEEEYQQFVQQNQPESGIPT